VFTAEDPDVIKSYVRKGMGVGVVACMAFSAQEDSDLVAINAAHLFPTCTTWVGFRRDRFLRDYMYAFLELVVPKADRQSIDQAIQFPDASPHTLAESGKLSLLNVHPHFKNQFSTCCNGEFNL
jgi:LysR family cys regulon transcriptional activator